jgi:hypothetical protein
MAGVLSRPLESDPLSPADAHLVEHLQRICASKTFESSATLKNLLTYLFQNRNAQVSEYAIAIGALYRRTNFDPQIDATVRVQISRLRRRLKDYYLSEGRSTNIRFSIPLGTHQLVLDLVSESALVLDDATTSLFVKDRLEVLPEAAFSQTRNRRRAASLVFLILGCLVVALAFVCTWQYWQLRSQARANAQGAAAQLLPLWREFCANGKPARIVIPNPTFFAWQRPNRKNFTARDVEVNTFVDIQKSPELSALRKQMGEPVLSEFYAVSSDVLASLKLMHYMDSGGASITTNISSDASAELFEGDNVILIGTPGTLTPFRSQLDRLYFRFDSQARVLINPLPLASEPREINLVQESPSRSIYPGLIAFLPGNSKGSHLLILAGSETAGLVTYLTSTAGSQALQEARNRAGGAPYFEAVILSEADGNTVLNSHMVEFRAFTPKATQN